MTCAYLDVPYELHPVPEDVEFSNTLNSDDKGIKIAMNVSLNQPDEDGDKENSSTVTTPAKKRRSKSAPPLSEIKQNNVADVSAYQ
jgi:hypothetical protein